MTRRSFKIVAFLLCSVLETSTAFTLPPTRDHHRVAAASPILLASDGMYQDKREMGLKFRKNKSFAKLKKFVAVLGASVAVWTGTQVPPAHAKVTVKAREAASKKDLESTKGSSPTQKVLLVTSGSAVAFTVVKKSKKKGRESSDEDIAIPQRKSLEQLKRQRAERLEQMQAEIDDIVKSANTTLTDQRAEIDIHINKEKYQVTKDEPAGTVGAQKTAVEKGETVAVDPPGSDDMERVVDDKARRKQAVTIHPEAVKAEKQFVTIYPEDKTVKQVVTIYPHKEQNKARKPVVIYPPGSDYNEQATGGEEEKGPSAIKSVMSAVVNTVQGKNVKKRGVLEMSAEELRQRVSKEEFDYLMDDAANTAYPLQDERFAQARQQPKSPKDEAALAAKYAAIESVEDRAFQILLDLGMIAETPSVVLY